MRKFLFLLLALFQFTVSYAQLLSWSPQFPADNSTIIITVDATRGNQGLSGHVGAVYMHLGVITNLSTSSSDWRYVSTSWGTTTAPAATSLGNNKWSFTLTNPRAYFNSVAGGIPATESILRIAILFRDGSGSKVQKNQDGSDTYVPVYAAGINSIQFTQPFIVPTFNMTNEVVTGVIGQGVPVAAVASTAGGTLNLYFNGTKINGPVTGNTNISGNPTVTSSGNQQIVAELIESEISYYDTIQFYLPPVNNILSLPPGVKEGINYWPGCDSVTLVLYAPNKTNAVVLGDFPNGNWVPQTQFQMNKTPDGNYYWLTVHGLTGGTEYAFEYLVDNTIYIADPYSEKVLDPWNDSYIPAVTYPGLKPYPSNANVSAGTNGIVSVLQTCAPTYNWQVTNFIKPDKRNLIIYELLVRDFGDARNYQMLIDTISYFKRLGINAIELMPVNEFSGNDSWGYNPTFYLALDKAYGTKDKFKEFVDICHKNGIAVILDVVYNHLDAYNAPQGKLYWDAVNGRPSADNPWLNISTPHPYGVFQDLNHTTAATQYWVSRALEYWISEYKIDGYRLDLAKGFTQLVTNETTVENFDGSRLDNLNRYYDSVVPRFPGTYMILEFLGQQRFEEQLYANKGFMLWGNSNPAYNQCTMGYSSNADFSKIVYNSSQQSFSTPAEIGYMESHDEERLMYKNLQYGHNSGGYNVKSLATALERQAAAATLFFTVPGPKMIWQFGERGYDTSINFNGRVGSKPPLWHYMADPNRVKLYNAYSRLINLRLANTSVFNSSAFTYDFYDNGGLFRRFQIADPAINGVRVTVIANFDVVPQTRSITFQTGGNWYNYLGNGTGAGLNGPTGSTFDIGLATTQNITLAAGEYHVYIYQPSTIFTFIGNGNWSDAVNWTYNVVPPAILPAGSEIFISTQPGGECILNTNQTIGQGAKFTVVAGKNIRIPLNLNIQ
ncbi:MAG: alpha-amylase family glycosyl hydrolase [Ferruginibacter sp.]